MEKGTQKKLDIKIGQTVFVEKMNRNLNRLVVEEHKVTKIGTKFFYIDVPSYQKDRFCIFTGKEDRDWGYSISQVYISMKDIEDKNLHHQLSQKLYKLFSGYGKLPLSLETLKKINDLVEADKTE